MSLFCVESVDYAHPRAADVNDHIDGHIALAPWPFRLPSYRMRRESLHLDSLYDAGRNEDHEIPICKFCLWGSSK